MPEECHHPGEKELPVHKNLTGSTFLSLEVAGKRVELLKEALPRLRSLAALSNTDHPGEKSELRATETAATSLGMRLIYIPFRQSPFGTSPELASTSRTSRSRTGCRRCLVGPSAQRRAD